MKFRERARVRGVYLERRCALFHAIIAPPNIRVCFRRCATALPAATVAVSIAIRIPLPSACASVGVRPQDFVDNQTSDGRIDTSTLRDNSALVL